MISAVVLAGYQNKREVKRYSKLVGEHYGETFIESGYKPLREFQTIENGVKISKPVIQFTLEKLFQMDTIEEIIIVGHKMLLEQRLGDFLKNTGKYYQIINQNKRLSNDIITRYNITPSKVKFNSVTGNLIKGYAATRASKSMKHALFVASDSPLTTVGFIEKFYQLSHKCTAYSAIVVPIIVINEKEDRLGRKPLRLINDSSYQLPGHKDAYSRQGFRLSSLLMANPNFFDLNVTEMAYNLRKFLSPKIQIRFFKITRNLGFSNIYSKYFLKKNLSVSDCEKITTGFFRGNLTIIPMEGEEASYDYDGTDKEYKMITEMLTT